MLSSLSLLFIDKIVIAIIAVSLVSIYRIQGARRRKHYPPGPPPRFFWGNFFDLPKDKPYKTYAEWAKIYGDITHVEAFGQHVVILNSQEISFDLLERRSQIYSDRAVPSVIEATGWPAWNLALSPYGQHWRDIRKLGQQSMKKGDIAQYQPVQAARAAELLKNILDTPQDFLRHVRTETTGAIMSIIYGYNVKEKDDPFVSLVDEAIRYVSGAIVYSGSEILNNIPFLSYIPSWVPFKQYLAKTRELSFEVCSRPFGQTKEEWMKGQAPVSVVSELLTKYDGAEQGDVGLVIRDLAGSLYAGAADTTPSAISTFILAMATNPTVQKQAQQEIDKVIGDSNRFPDFPDRSNMPHVEAILHEVLRYSLVLPLSLPHLSTTDDVYNGYLIPKGTLLISNIWSINHDERVFEDPSSFKPSRFLSQNGELLEKLKPVSESPIFGHGRRKCPGRHLAEGTMWITIAYMLATFDMSSPKDKNGNEIKLEDVEFEEGIVYHPRPFSCTILPRSEKKRDLILKASANLTVF